MKNAAILYAYIIPAARKQFLDTFWCADTVDKKEEVKRVKLRKWIGMLGAAVILCMTVAGTGAAEVRGGTVKTAYALKDLTMEKSSDTLAAETGGDGFVYIGNDNQAESVNQWAAFSFETEAAGDYQVKLVTKKHDKKGVFQMSIDEKITGEPYDQYGNGGECTVDFGTVHIERAGTHQVKFEILEKNPNCSTYQIAVKTLELTRQEDTEIPDVEFGEDKVSESGAVISYPMPYIYHQSTTFSVKADGLEIPVTEYRGEYDYAHFSMDSTDGPVAIEVTYKEAVSRYEISPGKLGIEGETEGNSLTFTLDEEAYLILRINNGKRLVIAADAMETEVPEQEGDGIFNILDEPYQAERTGTNLSTEAIQRAIDDASRYGTENGTRGTVYVPKGVYQSSSLVLKSNMELYLEGGAVIRATLDGSKYVVRGNKNSIGKDVIHFIYTENNKIANPYDPDYHNTDNYIESENMKVYGRGTIDARGRDLEKEAGLLSQSLIPMNCSGFTADGLILRDTGVWSVAPGLSDNLEFTNLKILNTMNHEDDCIDINGCQDVIVRNVIGVALDDPFSTKTWETGELFQAWCGEPEVNENILFEDCLSWSYCYGFKVGQGSWRDQRNIVFRDSTVYDCAVGLGVHHKYGTAVLEDITFENIDIEHITNTNDSHRTWLHMQAITGGKDGNKPIRNVAIRNIRVYDKGTSTAKLVGFNEEYGIEGIEMERIYMDHIGGYAENLADLDIKDLYMYCGGLTLDGKKLPDSPAISVIQLEDLIGKAELSESCPEPGVGDGYVYIGKAVGDWVSFPVSVKAGTYKLEVMLKKHESKGIFQMYVNDIPTGEPYDQYYNGNKTGVTADFGTITFEEDGVQNFRFEITGKNEASKGYQLVIDALKLTGINKEPVLEQIGIARMPEKTTYFTGEKADFTGLAVTAHYDNGDTRELKSDEYTVEGFQTEKPGVITITVSCEGKTAVFDLEVIDFSEDTQKAMEELTDRIASASNAEQIRETADDVASFFDTVEAITNKVFELVRKLEQALLRLDKSIRPTKTTVAEEVKELFGIRAGDVKVEGAAVTAHANRFDEETASPSNAVFRIEEEEETWEIPEGYDEESAAKLRFCLDVVSGDEVTEEVELAVPVRLRLPYPADMSKQDVIRVFHYSDSGEMMGRLVPELGESGLTVIVDRLGSFVIAKEKTAGNDPDDSDIPDDPGTPDEPGGEDQPDTPEKPGDEEGSDSGRHSSNSSSSKTAALSTTPGDWIRDEHGWWYRLKDGNYPKNDWVICQGVWYYFDENGYMKTGWVLWKEKWYYLNESGACVVDTVTPDGYTVDADGAWVELQR